MTIPILPSESRAGIIALEEQELLPTGLLQGIADKQTGWRPQNNLLPSFMLPEEQQGENQTEQDVLSQQLVASAKLKDNLNLFDNNIPLATHAFLYGEDRTKQALQTGFEQNEIDDIFDVGKRIANINGEEISDDHLNLFSNTIGKPSRNVLKKKLAKAPNPQLPISLKRDNNGRYWTGDPLFDTIIEMESQGKANAVSPTGATGLFQFTKGTGKSVGLIGKHGDQRRDPNASLLAMKKLTNQNIKYLEKHGIPITPTNIYLAHQQGAEGTRQLYEAYTQGKGVSKTVMKNMGLNWSKGKSPAQFYSSIDKKLQAIYNRRGGNNHGEIARVEPKTQAKRNTNWLEYHNKGKIRNKPLAQRLVNDLDFIGDMGLTMKVYSGGQTGKRRTGSHRHDYGNAGDVDFYKDGRKLSFNNKADRAILQEIVRRAKANGVTGFGAGHSYMGDGRMHIGYGTPAVWGAGGKGANAPQWLREAFNASPIQSNKQQAIQAENLQAPQSIQAPQADNQMQNILAQANTTNPFAEQEIAESNLIPSDNSQMATMQPQAEQQAIMEMQNELEQQQAQIAKPNIIASNEDTDSYLDNKLDTRLDFSIDTALDTKLDTKLETKSDLRAKAKQIFAPKTQTQAPKFLRSAIKGATKGILS